MRSALKKRIDFGFYSMTTVFVRYPAVLLCSLYQVDVRLCGDLTVKHVCEVYKSKEYNIILFSYDTSKLQFEFDAWSVCALRLLHRVDRLDLVFAVSADSLPCITRSCVNCVDNDK